MQVPRTSGKRNASGLSDIGAQSCSELVWVRICSKSDLLEESLCRSTHPTGRIKESIEASMRGHLTYPEFASALEMLLMEAPCRLTQGCYLYLCRGRAQPLVNITAAVQLLEIVSI